MEIISSKLFVGTVAPRCLHYYFAILGLHRKKLFRIRDESTNGGCRSRVDGRSQIDGH